MLEAIAPLVLLIMGALVGLLVGVAHAYSSDVPVLRAPLQRDAARCPYCRCRMA